MTSQEIFRLLAARYESRPDDFRLSIGHFAAPFPNKPLTVFNMPDFCGQISLSMGEVRVLAEGREIKD